MNFILHSLSVVEDILFAARPCYLIIFNTLKITVLDPAHISNMLVTFRPLVCCFLSNDEIWRLSLLLPHGHSLECQVVGKRLTGQTDESITVLRRILMASQGRYLLGRLPLLETPSVSPPKNSNETNSTGVEISMMSPAGKLNSSDHLEGRGQDCNVVLGDINFTDNRQVLIQQIQGTTQC